MRSKKQEAFLHEQMRNRTAGTSGKLPSVPDPMRQALANKRQEHAENLGVAPKIKAITAKVKIRKGPSA